MTAYLQGSQTDQYILLEAKKCREDIQYVAEGNNYSWQLTKYNSFSEETQLNFRTKHSNKNML